MTPTIIAIAAIYTLMSLITLIAYRRDKNAAKTSRSRTPERTLHTLELLGGWPGALIAQRLFRHKTRKLSYQLTFYAIVALHLAAIAFALWLTL